MRKIIHDVDQRLKIFYIIYEGRRLSFYLSNKLFKTFYDYLKSGVLVDFEITDKMKKIGRTKHYQVAYFNQIISLNPYYVHYDLIQLRDDMKEVLEQNRYFLFIDFEMTMPGYNPSNFKPEIIQMGYVLSETKHNIICENGYYVSPIEVQTLSRRTKRFLNLDEEKFFQQARPFSEFYEELKHIMETYKPKLVVWGKNDLFALDDAYAIHQLTPITQKDDFIDLLKLHKDYFNLKDDLGLFKAYKAYYGIDNEQTHDAKDDALTTKYVFDAFIEYIR